MVQFIKILLNFMVCSALAVISAASPSLADSDLIFDTGDELTADGGKDGNTIYYPTPAARPNAKQSQYYESDEISDLPPSIKPPRRSGYQGNAAARVGKAATRGFWKALLPGIPSRCLPR